MRYLEERVAAQDRAIVEKDRRISSLTSREDAWFDRMEVGGVMEVEAVSPGEGKSDADAATVELGAAIRIRDWAGAEVVLLYDDEEDLNVDAATLTVGPPDGPWSFTAGQYPLPFGTTSLASDPVTLEIGETALESGFEGFGASAFAFSGGPDRGGDDRISGFGAAAGYAMESEDPAFGVNVSWIDDPGESDAIEVILGDEGAEPASWSPPGISRSEARRRPLPEAGSGRKMQSSLPKWLVGLSVGLADGVALGFEWKRDTSEAEGGGGKNSDATLLSAEF